MESTRETLLFLISAPLYAVVIGLEILLSFIHEKHYYTTRGTLANIYLSTLNFLLDILVLGICLAILSFFFHPSAFILHSPFLYWLCLFIALDFMFYLLHYVDHHCRLFWASHVTHHSSEEFNLTVGFRSSVLQPLYRFIYFIPLALIGFRPMDIMFTYACSQIYGILIHTQFVNRLGFLEWFLATPSHHRVHHAKNPVYLDKNLGMVLIIWDRMFGTFQPELKREKPVYGLTKRPKLSDPVSMVFHEWAQMAKDLLKPAPLKAKLLYIFGPPGWSHDGTRKTSKQLREEHMKSGVRNS
jgi:sterol desaturase/sphingolipid hydroxylase (fatty acid hydroxylase superfamily)